MTVSIKRWEPENIIFWLTRGRRIANRNLLLSTLALHLNFNVWMMWSIVVSNLPAVGFAMTGQQQFLLVSIPPLVGPSCGCFMPASGAGWAAAPGWAFPPCSC
jgi:NNP family nitrate/nitrite transporter-like MFS transporter